MALQENPPTQREMAKRLHTSQRTIRKILEHDAQLKVTFKRKVHRLSRKHILERMTNARKLYEGYLAGDRWKFVVTLDEAWIYLDGCNKKRAICYRKISGSDDQRWCRAAVASFLKGFMIIAGFSYNGNLRIRRVDLKTKINSLYYQQNVIRPIMLDVIPKLYGSDRHKVWVHQDKASSHTSRSTTQYSAQLSEETGINIIPFSAVPVKSPDAAPMDFCAFGLLQQALTRCRPSTLDGLWKVCEREWDRIDLAILRRSLLSWKLRCRAIVKNKGYQIEHLKHKNFGL